MKVKIIFELKGNKDYISQRLIQEWEITLFQPLKSTKAQSDQCA